MASSKATTSYGPRKLGRAAHARQQQRKKVTTAGGRVYGSRKGGGGSVFGELKAGLFENSVGWAKALVLRLTDPKEVAAAHALETSHPKHEGGRKGVLDALEERKGELGIAAAGGAPNIQVPPEDEKGDSTPETGGDQTPDITQLQAALEEDPSKLDELLEIEFQAGEPRPEAVELFLEVERQREGGPRPPLIELLEQHQE